MTDSGHPRSYASTPLESGGAAVGRSNFKTPPYSADRGAEVLLKFPVPRILNHEWPRGSRCPWALVDKVS